MIIIKSIAILSFLLWIVGVFMLLFGGAEMAGISWVVRLAGIGVCGWLMSLIVSNIILSNNSIASARIKVSVFVIISGCYILLPMSSSFELLPGGLEFYKYLSELIEQADDVEAVVFSIILRNFMEMLVPLFLCSAIVFVVSGLITKIKSVASER